MVNTPGASTPTSNPAPTVVSVNRPGNYVYLAHTFYSLVFNVRTAREYTRVQSSLSCNAFLPRWVWCSAWVSCILLHVWFFTRKTGTQSGLHVILFFVSREHLGFKWCGFISRGILPGCLAGWVCHEFWTYYTILWGASWDCSRY